MNFSPSRRADQADGAYSDIVAVMMAYNEEDVIASSIDNLTSQGIGVYVIDNWSTDKTAERASAFHGRGLIGIEKFPLERPSAHFSLQPLLKRAEQLHHQLGARWCIHLDADEISTSPWPHVSLPEAINRVEQQGFNAINHISLFFQPTDNGYDSSIGIEKYFHHYEVGDKPWDHKQLRIWKHPGVAVEMADGGHQASFPGRKIFPTPFLKKHYAIRSQAHGEKKILQERLGRFDPDERAQGWHCHYDDITSKTNFLRERKTLSLFDEVVTKQKFLHDPPTMPEFKSSEINSDA